MLLCIKIHESTLLDDFTLSVCLLAYSICLTYWCHTLAILKKCSVLRVKVTYLFQVWLSQSDFFHFVSAVLELPPIYKDPKIASQLSVPASIRPHDSVRSASGMQRQALRLRLDAYHVNVSSDWMLIITISCCRLMTFTVSAMGCHRGARRQRLDFPWYFSHKFSHTFRLLLRTCLLCPKR